jgi:hypothetical protein
MVVEARIGSVFHLNKYKHTYCEMRGFGRPSLNSFWLFRREGGGGLKILIECDSAFVLAPYPALKKPRPLKGPSLS